MKKIFLGSLVILSVVSCEKIKQTTDTVKKADSLISTVRNGYKTLDSISTIINDTAKANSEFRKQKEIIEKQVNIKNLNVKNVDSVSSALKKITEGANNAQDISKTIDSVQDELKNSDDPMKSIAIISKTIDKAIKQNEAQNTQNQNITKSDSVNYQSQSGNILTKKGNFQIEVSDFEEAKIQLDNIFKNNSAQIISNLQTTGNSNENEQTATVKIPAKNYEKAVADIKNLGTATISTTQSTGYKYNPEQLYDMTVMVYKPFGATATNPMNYPNSPVYPNYQPFESFTNYVKYFALFVLLILAGLIFWLISASKKRKKTEEALRKMEIQRNMEREAEKIQREKEALEKMARELLEEQRQQNPEPKNNPDDYTRYMPK